MNCSLNYIVSQVKPVLFFNKISPFDGQIRSNNIFEQTANEKIKSLHNIDSFHKPSATTNSHLPVNESQYSSTKYISLLDCHPPGPSSVLPALRREASTGAFGAHGQLFGGLFYREH